MCNIYYYFIEFIFHILLNVFQFVYAAQELCTRLILSGYWADFINPFSGRPFNGPVSNNNKVYDPEEQFLCLGFSIDSKDKLCTIIKGEHEGQKFFKGNFILL